MDGHFETLVYTDCRPGQGLRGSAGLQFQARSSDAVAAAETLVKDHLLYEPPSRWMADRRPVADYPRSFAHMSASGFIATATGLYLGREANGVREGNQLTHAIVTTDPDSYGGLRPAQLYGAAFWSDAPAPTTRSEPVTLNPSGGPYSPARAKQFVLAQPDGPRTLLALVAALHRAGEVGAGRVLFVADDVTPIVEWLVAGTLLIPRHLALRLGFKIFSNDPARSRLPIVAVHTEFAGPAARIDNQLGYLVFDLTTHQHTAVPAPDHVGRWVGLFLDGDPRDAVDALDVAAESDIEDDEPAAAALGLAAILHEEPSDPDHARKIVGWLRTGPQRLRDAYGADLADLFADVPERWSRDVLHLLDEVGSDGLLPPGKAAEVRIALLLKDVEEAIAGGRVTAVRPAPLPPGEWGPDRDEQVRDLLREAVEGPGRPGRTIEALLRVAHRYSADLHPQAFDPGGRELAVYLADHPEMLHPERWPNGSEVEDLLIAELSERARQGGPAPAAVGDLWRGWLMSREAVPRVLVVAALGAAVRHGDDRTALIRRALNEAHDPQRYADQATALFSQSRPTLDEMAEVVDRAPEGTPPIGAVFDELARTVAGRGPVTADEIQLCLGAFKQGLVVASRTLETTLAKTEQIRGIAAEMRQAPDDPKLVKALLTELAALPDRLIAPYEAQVADALLRIPLHGSAAERLLDTAPSLQTALLKRLVAALRAEERPAAAFTAFWLTRGKLADNKEVEPVLTKALDQWLLRVPEKKVVAAGELIASCLSKEWSAAWSEHIESLSGRRRRYKLSHPFGGRS